MGDTPGSPLSFVTRPPDALAHPALACDERGRHDPGRCPLPLLACAAATARCGITASHRASRQACPPSPSYTGLFTSGCDRDLRGSARSPARWLSSRGPWVDDARVFPPTCIGCSGARLAGCAGVLVEFCPCSPCTGTMRWRRPIGFSQLR